MVGLDTMAHVIKTMADTLPDDPWHRYFKPPDWLEALIDKGALGQKTGAGIYPQGRQGHPRARSSAKRDYRPQRGQGERRSRRRSSRSRIPAEKFAQAARLSSDPQAQFLWAMFRDLFHYTAYHLADIADTARDVDFAIRWGYGWKLGPFETWQAAGWQDVARWIAEDIAAGKAMSDAPLPAWVADGRTRRASRAGSYLGTKSGTDEPRSDCAGLQAPALSRMR